MIGKILFPDNLFSTKVFTTRRIINLHSETFRNSIGTPS